MIVVQKYGGSSVATIEQIKQIALNLSEQYRKGKKLVVVVSAMGKTTNNLIAQAKEISQNPSKRDMDFLLSTGEMKSVSLLSIALNELGCKSICLTGRQAGIKTNGIFGKAFIENINTKRIEKELAMGKIVVVAGFQGACLNGEITTLGRGGSDTTAVALASALKAKCEIYTDVDGVYKIDPRIYSESHKFKEISHESMMEMAVNGSKVLDARCVEIAKKFNVELYLGKTLEKNKKGTYVVENKKDFFEKMKLESVSFKDGLCLIRIEAEKEFKLKEFFKGILNGLVNLDMVSKEIVGNKAIISFCVPAENAENVKKEFLNNKHVDNVFIGPSKTKVSLIGYGLSTHTGLSKDVFEFLENNNIEVEKFSITQTSICFLTELESKEKLAKLLSKKFNI